jgi:hypothetical protein
MQTRVRVYLGETVEKHYLDTEVASAINYACEIITAELELNLTFREYTTAAGTYRYSLPVDWHKLKEVYLVDAGNTDQIWKLTQTDNEQYWSVSYGAATQQSRPEYYKLEFGAVSQSNASQIPGDIWLYPVPDSNSSNNYTLRVYYYQIPATLSTGTHVSILPLPMHEMVCEKAAADLAIKGKDYQLAQMMEQRYLLSMDKARRMYSNMSRDRYPHMKDVNIG